MIDIGLIDEPVCSKEYRLKHIDNPALFLGFIIKNSYDNKRLIIDESFQPEKFSVAYNKNQKINVLPLYGVIVSLNELSEKLISIITNQEKYWGSLNLQSYIKILNEFNLSCSDCYGYFYKNVYPIDNKHFDILTNDAIGGDKRIFQHMLNIDENKFDFQKFGSLKLLLLT